MSQKDFIIKEQAVKLSAVEAERNSLTREVESLEIKANELKKIHQSRENEFSTATRIIRQEAYAETESLYCELDRLEMEKKENE